MPRQQSFIRRKLNLLEPGRTRGNISGACRKLGAGCPVSRACHGQAPHVT
jgi:hypothetical protein